MEADGVRLFPTLQKPKIPRRQENKKQKLQTAKAKLHQPEKAKSRSPERTTVGNSKSPEVESINQRVQNQ